MFWYDKDQERVMQHKKREILKELEEAKNRILKELSGVDKITLTRLREIIADYNRIDFNINEKLKDLSNKIEESDFSILYKLYNDVNTAIQRNMDEIESAFSNVENGLQSKENKIEELRSLINSKVNETLNLISLNSANDEEQNSKIKTNADNYALMYNLYETMQKNVMKLSSDVGSIVNSSIPENYVSEQINAFITENNGGFALQNDVDIINEKLNSERNELFIVFPVDIANHYVAGETGEAYSHDDYYCSDYINIKDKEFIVMCEFNSAAGIAFYDENKQYLSGINNLNYSVPQNAYFIRVSNYLTNTGKVFVVNNNLIRKKEVVFNFTHRGYINYSTGLFHVYGDGEYKSTDYLLVPDVILTNCEFNSGSGCAYYDENKNFMFGFNQIKNGCIKPPNNAKYIRLTNYDTTKIHGATVKCIYGGLDSNKNNPLFGKKLSFIGDSLMCAYYKKECERWTSLIGERNCANVVNLGISGNPITKNPRYSELSMSERISTIPLDSDYIMLMGGANDFNHNVPIGTNEDNTNETFKGALNCIIKYLLDNYPTAKILFATTYRRNAERNDEKYAEAMKEICNLWGVKCIDNYHCSGVHFFNEAWMEIHGAWTYTNDIANKMENRHLNAKGDEFVSWIFENALKSI